MSQLHVGNQQFFRQYAPDSELPLESRIFTVEHEVARRQQGSGAQMADFSTPISFNISMNNELYFLRSCHLRLPIQARFVDEFGNVARSPEEVGAFAVRNRPDRCFKKIESNLNGFRATRDPDALAWEEYLVTDDEYGVFSQPNDGIGVPINSAQVTSATRVGTQQTACIGSAPVPISVPSEENPNFASRARMFSEGWDYDNARWDSTITIPVEVGVHRPYSSKKAVRTKFVPYIGTEELRFEWKNYKAEHDYRGSATDHMAVGKYLFEQGNRLHTSARDAPIARQIGQTEAFSLWFGDDDMAFMIVPHDNVPTLGMETSAIRCHEDVCARFPPGSTVEFDAAQFEARGQPDGVNSYAANWVDKPWRVFRCQDCTLGAVGGMFGRLGIAVQDSYLSAAAHVGAVSQMSDPVSKYASYVTQLQTVGEDGAAGGVAGMAWLNAVRHMGGAQIQTHIGVAQNSGGRAHQLGRVLCERSSVVIFTRDSWSMIGKADALGGVVNSVNAANVNLNAAGEFPVDSCPQCYFVTRRYKLDADGALGIPEELRGQLIATELMRCGHQALLGSSRYAANNVIGAGIAAVGLAPGAVGALEQANSLCFMGRFEAKEGEYPPSMTATAAGVITPMTSANMTDFAIANRWDEFVVRRFVALGNAGDADANKRDQLTGGMNTITAVYNAHTFANVVITAAAGHLPYGSSLTPHDNQVTDERLAPTHTLGRIRYVVTSAGQTSAMALNALGARTAAQYVGDVEASSCYAYQNAGRFETRIPSSRVPIKRIEMEWTGTGPVLLCEWAVLKKIEPVYSLYFPQFESFVDDTFDATIANVEQVQAGVTYRYGSFNLPLAFASVERKMNALRINEVPSLICIRCELAEEDRSRFDWMDLRAFISNVKIQLNERPDLTSNIPDIIGYRWFIENSKTLMSYEEWKANCMWLISPQQLSVDSKVFTESLAKVNTMTLAVTVKRPKAYKNAAMNYRDADFWPAYKDAAAIARFAGRSKTTPRFQVKVNFLMDNHSLVMNSRREVMLRKNVLKATGVTGLVRDERGLPKMGGLLAGPSAPSGGAKAVSGQRAY